LIKFKQGARGATVKVAPVEMLVGLIQAEAIFSAHGSDLVITEWWRCRNPGKPSLHPVHHAVDIRANNIASGHRTLILKDLQAAMDKNFDFLLHGVGSGIHFHMEYQPKIATNPR
jgi:hypothetical protein